MTTPVFFLRLVDNLPGSTEGRPTYPKGPASPCKAGVAVVFQTYPFCKNGQEPSGAAFGVKGRRSRGLTYLRITGYAYPRSTEGIPVFQHGYAGPEGYCPFPSPSSGWVTERVVTHGSNQWDLREGCGLVYRWYTNLPRSTEGRPSLSDLRGRLRRARPA
jgi:hypothetical protein